MLSDMRSAPSFGGQEFMEYKRYGYRLCDYALFFPELLLIPVAVVGTLYVVRQ
jgi:hypothetical protein